MSGALCKKLGLVVTSAKVEGNGRVYRVGQPDLDRPHESSEHLPTDAGSSTF